MTQCDEVSVPAVLWEPRERDLSVLCSLCAHHCRIDSGDRGLCGIRENRGGELRALTFGCAISAAVDPIEKKPLFHFLPASTSFSIATVGCNFRCSFCQNSDISQMPLDSGPIRGSRFPPEEVVAQAIETGCSSISYTYTEPTVYLEYALACAEPAVDAGLMNVFVTNGYMTPDALDLVRPYLHAANVDLKSFDDDFYRTYVGARLSPVLRSIRQLVDMGVWVEVTTLVIPGLNDGDDELRAIAGFLAGIDPNIPWHVSRFHPSFQLLDRPPTPVATIERAVAIGKQEGLHYVYAGNVPGGGSESTSCPECGAVVIERAGFRTRGARLRGDSCGACGARIAGVFLQPENREGE